VQAAVALYEEVMARDQPALCHSHLEQLSSLNFAAPFDWGHCPLPPCGALFLV